MSVVSPDKVPQLSKAHGSAAKPDNYSYRTGKVNHLKPDMPVIDDGCSTPPAADIRFNKLAM